MRTPSARFFGPAAVLAAVTFLTGCAHQDAPGVATASRPGATASSSSPDRARQAQQYIDCMRGHGVVMVDELTSEGIPQVDKGRTPLDRVGGAMAACKGFLSSAQGSPRPAAQDIEKRRQYSMCIRSHGVSDYPDPDPDTGDPKMSDDLARRLKADPHLTSAMQACQNTAPITPGKGVVGG